MHLKYAMNKDSKFWKENQTKQQNGFEYNIRACLFSPNKLFSLNEARENNNNKKILNKE